LVVVAVFGGGTAFGQITESASTARSAGQVDQVRATVGRIAFDFPQAPPATVEIDLSEGILQDLSGITEAAIAGFTEALGETARSGGGTSQRLAAVAAAQQIVQTLGTVVRELHVRVYDRLPEGAQDVRERMVAHYHEKLREAAWDNVVRFREGNDSVTLAVLRGDGAVRGLFLVFSDNRQLIIAEAQCDLTPEKVKLVAHQLTKIGVEFGLTQEIERALRGLERPTRRDALTRESAGTASSPSPARSTPTTASPRER
jgi:hypothetical protein